MSATIDRFTLVQINDVDTSLPSVIPWTPAAYEQPGLATAHKLLGVTTTDSEFGQDVETMSCGYLRDVAPQNLESWAAGDLLWAKADGSISHTPPDAPLPQVFIGTVVSVDGGLCFVDVDMRIIPSLGELSGVLRDTPEDLDVFVYNAAGNYWDPRRLTASDVAFDPSAAGMVSTDVQAAIEETQRRAFAFAMIVADLGA